MNVADFCTILVPRAATENDRAAFRETAAALRDVPRTAARAAFDAEREAMEAMEEYGCGQREDERWDFFHLLAVNRVKQEKK